MKIARQIASFIGLKSAAGKPAATPQPIARRASTPGGALQGLARQLRQAERPATAVLREGPARPRVDASALRHAASGTGGTDSTAQRGKASPLPPKTLRRSSAFKTVAVAANARARSKARPPAQKEVGKTALPSHSGSGRSQDALAASPRAAPEGVKKIVVPTRPAPPSPEGAVAHRVAPIGVKKIVLPTRPAPPPPTQSAPASQNRDAAEATPTGGVSPDTLAPESGLIAQPFATHASTAESATKPAAAAQPAAPSTSVAKPTTESAASAGSGDTHGLDGKDTEKITALGQAINERVDAMHLASNASPLQASADVLLQEAIALRELALLLSDLVRQLIQRGGQAVVSLTAN